jgi:chromosome segregation ATPase
MDPEIADRFALLHGELNTIERFSTFHADLREIKTLLKVREESISQNSKNIGEAFKQIREIQHENQQTLVEIRALATGKSFLEQEVTELKGSFTDLKATVQGMKDTIIKWSCMATLFTAVIVAALVKYFSG